MLYVFFSSLRLLIRIFLFFPSSFSSFFFWVFLFFFVLFIKQPNFLFYFLALFCPFLFCFILPSRRCQHGPPADLGEDKLSDDFTTEKVAGLEGEYDHIVVGSDLGGELTGMGVGEGESGRRQKYSRSGTRVPRLTSEPCIVTLRYE